jgi:hypothetical protein
MNDITIENLREFAISVFTVAKKRLADKKDVEATLFTGLTSSEVLAVNVDDLLVSNESKHILGMIPSYLAFIQDEFIFSAMLNEAWMVKIPEGDKSDDWREKAEKMAADLLKKHGSVSEMPVELRQEILCLHIESKLGEFTVIWNIERDTQGNATLLESDSALLSTSTSATGRIAQAMECYNNISQSYAALKARMDKDNISTELLSKEMFITQIAKANINGLAHAEAFGMATAIMDQHISETPRKSAFH